MAVTEIKVFQLSGYPKSHYFVKHQHWSEMSHWMIDNDVDYLLQSSTIYGVGFSIKKNLEWFLMRWA